MTATVDFYYSLGSRYSYLAATQIARIERDTGAVFDWRPLQSGRLMARGGGDPFAGEPLSGQYDWGYRRRDAEAWAAYYRVPFRESHGRLRFDEELVARAALAAKRQGAAVAMSLRIFAMVYEDDRTALDADDYIDAAKALGLDEDRYERDLEGEECGKENEASIEEAARRGAFGVPTFFVGERMFWGNDRLPLVGAALRGDI